MGISPPHALDGWERIEGSLHRTATTTAGPSCRSYPPYLLSRLLPLLIAYNDNNRKYGAETG